MATYPDVPQVIGTIRSTNSGLVVERAISGKPRFRRYFSQFRYGFRVRHECGAADKALIEAHYTAHKMLEFELEFAPDSVTYQVQYANAPSYVPLEGEERWAIESLLVETFRKSFGVVKLTIPVTITVVTERTSKFKAVVMTGATSITSAGRKRPNVVTAMTGVATVTSAKRTSRAVAVTVSVSESVSATGTSP